MIPDKEPCLTGNVLSMVHGGIQYRRVYRTDSFNLFYEVYCMIKKNICLFGALLLSVSIAQAQESASASTGEKIKETAHEVGEKVKETSHEAAQGIKHAAHSVGTGVKDAAHSVGSGTKKVAHKIGA